MRLAIFMLIVAMIAGCNGKARGRGACRGKGKEGTGVATGGDPEYPEQLTYWVSLNANASATMQDMNGIAAYQELENDRHQSEVPASAGWPGGRRF